MNQKDKADLLTLLSLLLQDKKQEAILFIKTIRLENDF